MIWGQLLAQNSKGQVKVGWLDFGLWVIQNGLVVLERFFYNFHTCCMFTNDFSRLTLGWLYFGSFLVIEFSICVQKTKIFQH